MLAADIRFAMDSPGLLPRKHLDRTPWRSLKYEALYLQELRDGLDAERIIGTWVDFYNDIRPHSSLGGRTPSEVYRYGATLS